MKKYILKSLFVSMLCMLAASCQDTELAETLDSSKAQVMFSLAMDSPSARSRSTWDDYTPTGLGNGTYYDNKIDYDQFIVKIIEANGTTYNVTDIFKWKEDEPEDGKYNEYNFVGTVKTADGKHVGNLELKDAKISVYVNMGKDNIADTFEQGAEYMPMFGFHTVNLNFAPGKREKVKTPIYLLRAMAKIEVALTTELAEEYQLAGVTLNQYNGTGNCLPNADAIFGAKNTLGMSTDGVFNEKKDSKTSLAFVPVEETSSYVVYLPEVAQNENLKIQVELLPYGAPEGTTPEVGSFAVKQYEENKEPQAINIVRNHWYKYTVSGFAASNVKVNYQTLDWQGVNIGVGGEKFLFLNKDVIEIYNSNIDADQLKFASSSPIKNIVLTDLYDHANNGEIVEGTKDGVSAYYISKFGQKIQLGTDPGFDLTDKDAALAREQVILSNIKAKADDNALNGGITITSPFLADSSSEIEELKQSSHYDTPRYLEFLVTNEQGLTATFRVIQYPPIVITNEEGYFSYREDFRVADLPIQYYQDHFTANSLGATIPIDNGEPVHYLNPIAPFFTCADFYPYHVHEWDPVKKKCVFNPTGPLPEDIPAVCGSCGAYIGFDEMTHGLMEREYMRVDEYKGSPVSEVFHRTKYYYDNNPSTQIGSGSIYQNLGPIFEREIEVDDLTSETGKKKIKKYYRRHYTGNSFIFYYALYVQSKNSNGKAVINTMAPTTNPVTKNEWGRWGTKYNDGNHRMYNIRTITASSGNTIGWPAMVTEDDRMYTAEGELNSTMISPSFMVASQLGATTVPYDRDGYDVPEEDGMYILARRHCEQYVEAVYEDTDKSGGYTPGDLVTHYDDWRLPTRAEIEVILQYQRGSRAMDKVLTAESYFCASSTPGVYNSNTVLTYLNKTIDQWTENDYHIRCVRDVKPGQQLTKVTYPIENR